MLLVAVDALAVAKVMTVQKTKTTSAITEKTPRDNLFPLQFSINSKKYNRMKLQSLQFESNSKKFNLHPVKSVIIFAEIAVVADVQTPHLWPLDFFIASFAAADTHCPECGYAAVAGIPCVHRLPSRVSPPISLSSSNSLKLPFATYHLHNRFVHLDHVSHLALSVVA